MLAEIREQPGVYLELLERAASWKRLKASSVIAVGSGSSFHAALLASRYFERLAGIPARVAMASEAFRYDVPRSRGTVALALSHSGSSRDVRAAVSRAKRQGLLTAAITNIDGAPLTRVADSVFGTGAGKELAVPSTKGFTALAAAALLLAYPESAGLIRRSARALDRYLTGEVRLDEVAATIAASKAVILLGQGLLYPVARDGALKLLEITYLPALAYPPREFLHGPLALVEPGVAVIALGGIKPDVSRVIRDGGVTPIVFDAPAVPRVPKLVAPLVYAPVLQLLAHAAGRRLGRPIDTPRGLKKVVGA